MRYDTGKQAFRVRSFNRGENSTDEPSFVNSQPGYATMIRNGYINKLGKVVQRAGLTSVGYVAGTATVSKTWGLARYHVGDTIDKLYKVCDDKLQVLATNYADWTDLHTLTTSLTTNFVQAKDLLFILNGTDNVHTMDSAEAITDEADTNTDPPKTTVGEWMANNRLFLAGSLTDSERDYVWFSDALDPQTFNRSTNVFKARSGSSGKITALKQFKINELIIYKNDSIFMLDCTGATPLTDWTLSVINPDVGCPAGRTVVNAGNDHIFLASDGVRMLSRTQFDKVRAGVFSQPVQSIIDSINKAEVHKSCAWFIDNKYYLAIPINGATENNCVLVWDSIASGLSGNLQDGWSVISEDTWFPAVFTEYDYGGATSYLTFGTNKDIANKVFKHVGTSDDGTAIAMTIRGPAHEYDGPSDCIWGPLEVKFEGGISTTAVISVQVNNDGFVNIGTISVGASAPKLPINLPFDLIPFSNVRDMLHAKQVGRGRKCMVSIAHSVLDKSPTFIEYTLWCRPISQKFV